MATYRRIDALQEPFDLGSDDHGRVMVAFNILVTKTPSDTFLEELVKILNTAGVGSLDMNIFVSSSAQLPAPPAVGTADPGFIHIRETGGTGPDNTQNETSLPAYSRPGAQVIAYAVTYMAARAKARAAYKAFVGIRNTVVTP